MSYLVSSAADAQMEIEKAKNWYNTQSPNLGDAFEKQVTQQLSLLRENPRINAIRYGKVRTMAVKRFAYTIYYIVHESDRTVIGYNVLHNNVNPDQWPRS